MQPELTRARRLRWLLLPLTLPILPQALRMKCLQTLMAWRHRRSRKPNTDFQPDFDESALILAEEPVNSVILIAAGVTCGV